MRYTYIYAFIDAYINIIFYIITAMLMIRLARIGKKKQPYYRLIVSEKARDMYGKSLEILGHYNPRTKAAEIKSERVKYWISQGAQASATVNNLLISNKIIEGKKKKSSKISKKNKVKLAKKNAEKKEAEKPTEKPVEEKTVLSKTEAEEKKPASAAEEKTAPAPTEDKKKEEKVKE
ncbi:MAG: 30S ribosomal protein S16 [bacterium]|nr:30S ribosomal protein S16 [bacterium]